MPRYRLTIEYDGSPFVGWQRQDNGPSVQGALEEAIFKLCGETVTVTGRPESATIARTRSTASSSEAFPLRRLNVSVAASVQLTRSTPAAARRS